MPKNIHTPRDELVCGKLDVLEVRLRELGHEDLLYLTADIRRDCEHMEAKLIRRKDEAERHTKSIPPNAAGKVPAEGGSP